MEVFYRIVFLSVLFVFSIDLFGYQLIKVNDPIKLHKASIYVSEDNLSIEKVYDLYTENSFHSLSEEARSFGRDTKNYWFVIELEGVYEDVYFDVKNISLHHCEFYQIYDGGIFGAPVVKGSLKKDKRIRFLLEPKQGKSLYFVKVSSRSPKFIAFEIGNNSQVETSHQDQLVLFGFTSGVFLFACVFYIFLLIKFKDRIYFYYLIHIVGIYISVMITSGYQSYFSLIHVSFLVLLALQMQFLGLVYFSDSFLRLKNYSEIRKAIFLLMYLSIIVSLLAFFKPPLHEILFFVQLILFSLLFYSAFRIAMQGSLFARYYMIGTGVGLLLMSLYTLTHKGGLPYNFYTFNLLHFALIWDALFLTFAVVSKIYQIQEDNINKERILKLKARQDTISSMMENIAHQWRSPLSQLGALLTTLQAKIEFSGISNDEQLEYIKNIAMKLRFLSQTVDSFEAFSIKSKKECFFNFSNVIFEAVYIAFDKNDFSSIEIDLNVKKDIFINGDENLIMQVVLSLLQNAKEAIDDAKAFNRKIIISLKKRLGFIEVQVSDNGKKIDYDTQEKIFEPFFTTKKEGKGIGLYLAKTIVEQNFDATLKLIVGHEFKTFQIDIPESRSRDTKASQPKL